MAGCDRRHVRDCILQSRRREARTGGSHVFGLRRPGRLLLSPMARSRATHQDPSSRSGAANARMCLALGSAPLLRSVPGHFPGCIGRRNGSRCCARVRCHRYDRDPTRLLPGVGTKAVLVTVASCRTRSASSMRTSLPTARPRVMGLDLAARQDRVARSVAGVSKYPPRAAWVAWTEAPASRHATPASMRACDRPRSTRAWARACWLSRPYRPRPSSPGSSSGGDRPRRGPRCESSSGLSSRANAPNRPVPVASPHPTWPGPVGPWPPWHRGCGARPPSHPPRPPCRRSAGRRHACGTGRRRPQTP